MLSTINKEASSQVDFVIARDGNVQELIQVSYDISTERTLKCGNLTLVTFEEQGTIEEEGCAINVIPATEWLLGR